MWPVRAMLHHFPRLSGVVPTHGLNGYSSPVEGDDRRDIVGPQRAHRRSGPPYQEADRTERAGMYAGVRAQSARQHAAETAAVPVETLPSNNAKK